MRYHLFGGQSAFLLALTGLLCASGCGDDADRSPVGASSQPESVSWFQEASGPAAVSFKHEIGSPDDFELPQIMGSGCALLDYDLDGHLDLYLVNFAAPDGFFRQTGAGFEDVREAARVASIGQGMAAIAGDVDNDGFLDLLVTGNGSVRLWRNNGDGTFAELTGPLAALNGFATAACFTDYDGDGNLDLYVVHYVDFVPGQWCEDASGFRDYCGPSAFAGSVDRLFRNAGSAGPVFEETTLPAGLAASRGKGLGVISNDFTGDGRPDFYVANDQEANHFWVQQPDGTFREMATLLGVALNRFGEAEASMGLTAPDFDNDGAAELFMTHLGGQTNTLYVPEGDGLFSDQTPLSGLGPPSLPYTGFGVAAVDFDHDGDLDVAVVNGRVQRAVRDAAASDRFLRDYAEPNQVYINDGSGYFQEGQAEGGDFSRRLEVSRGLAAGDLDNDGDIDCVVTNCRGPARVYLNQAGQGRWLQVRLAGTNINRNGIGAQVTVGLPAGRLHRWQIPNAGYLCSHDHRLHFGLGTATEFSEIVVRWPNGVEEQFPGGPADRVLTLTEGTGQPVRNRPEGDAP